MFRSLRAMRYSRRLRANRRCSGLCRWVVCSLRRCWKLRQRRPVSRMASEIIAAHHAQQAAFGIPDSAECKTPLLVRDECEEYNASMRGRFDWFPWFFNTYHAFGAVWVSVSRIAIISGVGISFISFFILAF